jgi:hypothetical protein
VRLLSDDSRRCSLPGQYARARDLTRLAVTRATELERNRCLMHESGDQTRRGMLHRCNEIAARNDGEAHAQTCNCHFAARCHGSISSRAVSVVRRCASGAYRAAKFSTRSDSQHESGNSCKNGLIHHKFARDVTGFADRQGGVGSECWTPRVPTGETASS